MGDCSWKGVKMGSIRVVHSMSGYSIVSLAAGIVAMVFVSTSRTRWLEYLHIGSITAYILSFTSIVEFSWNMIIKFTSQV